MENLANLWTAMEQSSFQNLTPEVMERIMEGIFKAIPEKMRMDLANGDVSEVSVPWGTYRAEVKVKGETTNITPTWEPSKGFLKYLNGDPTDPAAQECLVMDDIDKTFLKLAIDWIAYAVFNPEDPKVKETIDDKKKLTVLSQFEMEYFLYSFARLLASIAREKQFDGKIYLLEIQEPFPHGTFRFEYDDDEIKVTWVPSKPFKQKLKDDSLSDNIDYSPITEPRVIVEEKPA